MDWSAAITRHREALVGILAGLVAMAAGDADTLPRHLHRAVLRLLRPAEAAARRLVIALAHTLPASQARDTRPSPPANPQGRPSILANGVGTGILMPPLPRAPARARAQTLSLPLFDRLRGQPFGRHARRRHDAAGVPRISVPGYANPATVAPRRPPSPDDPISAGRLRLRLQAVVSALDDLPDAARRFARWQARRHAAGAPDDRRGRMRHLWPLKPGRPPGWRGKGPVHAVHEVLNEAHWLALAALERPDTS